MAVALIKGMSFVPFIAEAKSKRLLESLTKNELEYVDEHKAYVEELCIRYSTDITNGLTTTQATKNLEKYGPNDMTKSTPTKTEFAKFIQYVLNGHFILWIVAIVGVMITEFMEFMEFMKFMGKSPGTGSRESKIVGIFFVFATKIFSYYYQYNETFKILELCKQLEPQWVKVTRDGQIVTIKEEELTKGDIVELKSGDRIPADLRVIYAEDCKVDNSSLIGESAPQELSTEFSHENILETNNIAFFSTNIVEGTCKGMVVKVGCKTVMGKLVELVPQMFCGEPKFTNEILHVINTIIRDTTFFGVACIFIAFTAGKYFQSVK